MQGDGGTGSWDLQLALVNAGNYPLEEDLKPEAVYFTEQGGQRGGILIVDVASPSDIPSIAEPFFLTFEAEVRFHVCMSPDDLAKAGLDELGKKWG